MELERDLATLRKSRCDGWVGRRKLAVGETEEGLASCKAAAKAERAEYEADCKAYNTARWEWGLKGSAARQEAVAANARAQEARKRVAALEGIKAKCPTCTQSVSDDVRVAAMGELGAVVEHWETARDAAFSQAEEADKARDELQCPVPPTFPEICLAEKEVEAEKVRLHTAQVALAKAIAEKKAATGRLEDFVAASDSVGAGRPALETEIHDCAAKLKEMDSKIARLEFWVEGFGHTGLKSFLIEAEIPAINKRASEYAQVLLGAGAKVRLQATTQLKTKAAVREKLSVEGSIPGCCASYAGASKGQKRRFDLALLLAFRDIVSSRASNPFAQFMADELFDGLDKAGCESVIELLRELSKDCPVTLVTHSPWLKSVVDRAVTVRHVEEYRATLLPKKSPSGQKKKVRKKLAH